MKKGKYILEVQNNKEGQIFLKSLNKFLNRFVWKKQIRGRLAERNGLKTNMMNDIPLGKADRFVVYFTMKKRIENHKSTLIPE